VTEPLNASNSIALNAEMDDQLRYGCDLSKVSYSTPRQLLEPVDADPTAGALQQIDLISVASDWPISIGIHNYRPPS
jgi:hypothetical protein